jgi:hypothetical protein
MTFQEQLDHLIIEKNTIPEAFVLPELIDQKTYLSNGELITWMVQAMKFFHLFVFKLPME